MVGYREEFCNNKMIKDIDYPLLKGIPLFENWLIDREKGFDEIYNAIKKDEPFYVVSGVRLLPKNHIGYKFLSQTINSMTKLGGKSYVFIPEVEDRLLEIKKKYLDMSLNPFFESLYREVKVLSDSKLSPAVEVMFQNLRKYSVKKILRTFGLKEQDDFGGLIGLLYSASSYFYPNILNNTDFPTLVLGVPAHKNIISFSRELAESSNIRKPSAILFKLMPGKDGSKKMSDSRPSSCIYMGEEQKFLGTASSGKPYKKKQLEFGGEPEKCVALKLAKYFINYEKGKNVASECRDGKLCYNCKKDLLTIIGN